MSQSTFQSVSGLIDKQTESHPLNGESLLESRAATIEHISRQVATTSPAPGKDGNVRLANEVTDALKAGKVHQFLRESYRLIDPESDIGKSFHEEISQFTNRYLKGLVDQLNAPPLFVLSDSDGVNAGYFSGSRPPVIVLNRGLFEGTVEGSDEKILRHPEDLAFIIAHEIEHALKEQNYGPYRNSKIEEGAFYATPLRHIHNAGLDPQLAAEGFLRLLKKGEDRYQYTIQSFIDDHPHPANSERILTGCLTALRSERGDLTPREKAGLLRDSCQNLNTLLANAKHQGWLTKILPNDYADLNPRQKVKSLTEACYRCDPPYEPRLVDLREEFVSLQGKLTSNTDAELLNILADSYLDLCVRTPYSYGLVERAPQRTAYTAITQIREGMATGEPLGRLRETAAKISHIISLCREGAEIREVRDACSQLNNALVDEPLLRTDAGRIALLEVKFARFASLKGAIEAGAELEAMREAKQAGDRVSKKRFAAYKKEMREPIAEWQVLRRYANHPEIAETIVRLNLASDVVVMSRIAAGEPIKALELLLQTSSSEQMLAPRSLKILNEDISRVRLDSEGKISRVYSHAPVLITTRSKLIEVAYLRARDELVARVAKGDEEARELIATAQKIVLIYPEKGKIHYPELANKAPEMFLILNGLITTTDSYYGSGDIAEVIGLDVKLLKHASQANRLFEELVELEKKNPGTFSGAFEYMVDGLHIVPQPIPSEYAGALLGSGALSWISKLDPSICPLEKKLFCLGEALSANLTQYGGRGARQLSEATGVPFLPDAKTPGRLVSFHKKALARIEEILLDSRNSRDQDSLTDQLQDDPDDSRNLKVRHELSNYTLASLKKMTDKYTRLPSKDLLFRFALQLDPNSIKEEHSGEIHAEDTFLGVLDEISEKDFTYVRNIAKKSPLEQAMKTVRLLGELGIPSREQEIELQEIILKRIDGLEDLDRKIEFCSEVVGRGYRVPNSGKIREQNRDMLISAIQESLGADNNSDRYLKELQKRCEKIFTSTTRSEHREIYTGLAKAVVAQQPAASLIESYVRKLEARDLENAAVIGVGGEAFLYLTRSDKEACNLMLDFFLSRNGSRGKEQLCHHLATKITEIHYEDRKKHFWHFPRYISNDPESERSLLYLGGVLDSQHENFWRQGIEGRALIVRELLLSDKSEGKMLEEELFKRALSSAFPRGTLSETSSAFLFSYLRALPWYSQHLGLAAVSAAGEQAQGGASEEEAIASLLEYLGPLETKGGQRAASSTLLSKEQRPAFQRLKYAADEPPRWEVIRWAEERREQIEKMVSDSSGKQVKIAHWKDLAGSASVSIALELEMDDGTECVLSIKRPYIEKRAEEGARTALLALDNLDPEYSQHNQLLRELIHQAKDQLALETNTAIAPFQFKKAEDECYNLEIRVDGFGFEAHAVDVMAAGDDWYLMSKADGEHYLDIPSLGAANSKYKIALAKAILTNEILCILKGEFDADRHGANLKVVRQESGGSIKHFDLKAMNLETPDKEGFKALADFLIDAMQEGINTEDLLDKMIEHEVEARSRGEDLHPFVRRVKPALLGLGDYINDLEEEDIRIYLISALLSDVCPAETRDLLVNRMPEMLQETARKVLDGKASIETLPLGISENQLVRLKKLP